MSLESLKNLVTSKAARQLLLTQKHSPRILFVAGTVGVVATTVLACRATLQLSDLLDEQEIGEKKLREKFRDHDLPENDLARTIKRKKVRTSVEIAKLYAPAVVVGAASVAALTGSHVVLTRRNGAAMAAYAGLDQAYKKYRQRVAEELGDEKDAEFALGSQNIAIEEKTADGETKTTYKKVIGDENGKFGGSPYAIVFDEFAKFFSREPGRNAMTIGMKQSYANDKLRAQGHLFLNEVYDMLGVPRTKAGNCVGWVWRRENEEKTGDNYVSFGVFGGEPELVNSFIDGNENRIVLDFNVDGMILDLI